jgi:aspartyl-tRNA(Asn)/glutamyl-tRNA(Gln) amidotransferase subunit B
VEYEVVIGLEIHAELSTQTKIYCSCQNVFGREVNTKCCPVCAGLPGTLPRLNKKVVEYAVKMGKALGCKINNLSKQDRKNYFYPDLPKSYQISQFDIPLCENGSVLVPMEDGTRKIGITRIHIEEDAGKLVHNDMFEGSLVDMNRCGVPLIEIVSEPDMRSSAEAKAYLETIKQILSYLNISDCKMEEGSIRCDINVSVMEKGSDKFGTRCEMKNVNSFLGAVHAIDYEAARQIKILEEGGVITQETRRWDDQKGMSFLLRSKEDAQDYRYFPEPDLKTIVVEKELEESIEKSIGELPNLKHIRYNEELGLPFSDAGLLAESVSKSEFFEKCLELKPGAAKAISNWMLSEISKKINETGKDIWDIGVEPQFIIDLINSVEAKTISTTAAKEVLEAHYGNGKSVKEIIDEKGLGQISNEDELIKVADEVLSGNLKLIEDYKNGKTNLLGFFVGQCMRLSKGKGNPAMLKDIVSKLIDEKY